jgi:hypothetical protein
MPIPYQVAFKPLTKPEVGVNGYVEPSPGKSEVIPKGSAPYNARKLESDVRIDHDVAITVRDGCQLYADIYRPTSAEKVPVIISWSPYGKKYSALEMIFNVCTWACCLERGDVSGLEKFEGLDPAWWVARGYAIASVDARGAGNSDGDTSCMGMQEAEDAHDVIEGLAKLAWCNGSVGMAGNSYLAIMQWHAAAQNPPSLKAIAPWEGSGDIFREQFCRGGWFNMSNYDLITTLVIKGNSGVEDIAEMYRRSPQSNIYWNDKRVDMTKINIPCFITGSDFSQIHTMGAIRGWMEVNTDKKWIKWSGYQEWFELYAVPESYLELKVGAPFSHLCGLCDKDNLLTTSRNSSTNISRVLITTGKRHPKYAGQLFHLETKMSPATLSSPTSQYQTPITVPYTLPQTVTSLQNFRVKVVPLCTTRKTDGLSQSSSIPLRRRAGFLAFPR